MNDTPWWAQLAFAALALVGGFEMLHFQRTVISFADLQTMGANLKAQRSGPNAYAGLNDKTADNMGIARDLTGSVDRSMISFSPAPQGAEFAGAFRITVSGVSQKGCHLLALKGVFDRIIVNGQPLEHRDATTQWKDPCRSTFWPWSEKNKLEFIGS